MLDPETQKFNDIIKEIAKFWDAEVSIIDGLNVVEIPYDGKEYPVCFSVLDDNFGLIVTQAFADVSDLSVETFLQILKSNSLQSSLLSNFFIHENREVSDNSPLLYQVIFPYAQFSVPEAVKFIESFIEQFAECMKEIEKVKDGGARKALPKKKEGSKPKIMASRDFVKI